MLEGINRAYGELLKTKGEEAANKYVFDESRKLSLTLRAIETMRQAMGCGDQRSCAGWGV